MRIDAVRNGRQGLRQATGQGRARQRYRARIGATLIKDIRPAGPRVYRARVFLADRNMNASGKIRQVAPDRLKVSLPAGLRLQIVQLDAGGLILALRPNMN